VGLAGRIGGSHHPSLIQVVESRCKLSGVGVLHR
jgi:hypothetical protein